MVEEQQKLDELCVNAIRMLAVDMVEKANSGHPGLPLGAAPMAYVLWSQFMRHNPQDPAWPNRDRFILSAGHGSALLYALLHLTGYSLSLDDLKNFRQWESLTPGHPEYGLTPGVEATTGPLGQGFAMGVGMALAERFLADEFNRPGFPVMDHYIYALASDGDLMEGVSSEAASLAGTLALGKLIYLYDDNGISIEGSTKLSFKEDVRRRFEAYGWQVIRVADGNDLDSIAKAVVNAQAEKEKPSLIMVQTCIGFGSPKQGSAAAHGEPLGREAVRKTREFFGWPLEEDFYVPREAADHLARVREEGLKAHQEWKTLWDDYRRAFPEEAANFVDRFQGLLPSDWRESLPRFSPEEGKQATRVSSGKVLNALAAKLPNLVGGSADLAPSNKTLLSGYTDFGSGRPDARNIRFGVREHAMGAVMNGMALHGGIIPYGGTFLVFSDYMRPSIRLAALMGTHVVFVFTHDSLGVGEDGPTHQPIEQLVSLRAIPHLTVIRPADANETSAAWKTALENSGPTALLLTRQGLPIMDPDAIPVFEGAARGAYVVRDSEGQPELILMASGSEVPLAVEAGNVLAGEGVKVRVVSMPSWELFEAAGPEYRDKILPPAVKARVSVEAGSPLGWERYTGDQGAIIGVNRFGASAPGGTAFKNFGFNVENVARKAKDVLNKLK
ncbi:MAG: transketolase [Pseudomonadota bacterium]